MKMLFSSTAFMFFTSLVFAAGSLKIPVLPHDTQINWVGSKVTGKHQGVVSLKEGRIEVKDAQVQGGSFDIDMSSIKDLDLSDPENNQKLVTHLKSDDFFGVEKNPTSNLEITSVKTLSKKVGDATHEVKAKLKIKGITQEISFPAKIEVNGKSVVWSSTLKIDRTKFNLKFRSGKFFENLGDKLIYDEFEIKVSFSAKAA